MAAPVGEEPGPTDLATLSEEPRPTDALTRWLGFPLHALLVTVPIGVLATSVLFDLGARIRSAPCSDFPYPSFLLLVVGTASGTIAALAGAVDLVRIRGDHGAFALGVRHLVTMLASLGLFGASAAIRHDGDFCRAVGGAPLALSLAGLALLLVASVWGLRLAHRPTGQANG